MLHMSSLTITLRRKTNMLVQEASYDLFLLCKVDVNTPKSKILIHSDFYLH